MLIEKRLGGKPCTLKVVIETNQPEKLWIKFSDADQNHTFYTKRYTNIEGRQDFYIRMPQAPDVGFLLVYNNDNPQGKGEDGSTFKVVETQVLPLQRERIRFNDKTESFIKFAQEFCERAGVLSCSKKGDIYKSDDLQFRIDYFDVIRDEKGRPLPTPARISKYNGLIEVSKFHFKDMSIPMRMAILCHEFCHFYVNKNPESEIQADINGLRIYLALGYPRIDAYNVFLNVFQTASGNPETFARFQTLDKFIKNYDYGKR